MFPYFNIPFFGRKTTMVFDGVEEFWFKKKCGGKMLLAGLTTLAK